MAQQEMTSTGGKANPEMDVGNLTSERTMVVLLFAIPPRSAVLLS